MQFVKLEVALYQKIFSLWSNSQKIAKSISSTFHTETKKLVICSDFAQIIRVKIPSKIKPPFHQPLLFQQERNCLYLYGKAYIGQIVQYVCTYFLLLFQGIFRAQYSGIDYNGGRVPLNGGFQFKQWRRITTTCQERRWSQKKIKVIIFISVYYMYLGFTKK